MVIDKKKKISAIWYRVSWPLSFYERLLILTDGYGRTYRHLPEP